MIMLSFCFYTFESGVESRQHAPVDKQVMLPRTAFAKSNGPNGDSVAFLLDVLQVYGELLGALESPIHGLFAFEGTAEELLSTFDAAAGSDLAGVLEYRAAQTPVEGQGTQ